MAVRGGLTRFARPCGAARLLRARSVQLAAPVVEPGRGFSSPCGEYKEKSPYFRTGSHLSNMAVRGGFRRDTFACAVCPTGFRTPVGLIYKRKARTRTPHHIVFPLPVGSPPRNWRCHCRTPVGFPIPCGEYKEKSPQFAGSSRINRTPIRCKKLSWCVLLNSTPHCLLPAVVGNGR